MKDTSKWLAIALVVFGVFVGGGICFVTDEDGSVRIERIPRKVPVAVPEGITIDKDNQVNRAEEQESGARPFSADPHAISLANAGPDIHEDARDETPPGITRDEADEALVTPPGISQPLPPAGAQSYRCPRHFVKNYSDRAEGTKVSMFVLHFTVSRPGSLNSIWNLFNTPSFGASSTLLLELDKECEQIVPFAKKAWTQGAFNSVSESVEIVTNDLSRSQWLASPIIKEGTLAAIVADRLRARGLPARLVDPVGCTPKSGYTDHNRLECGNSHWDVGSNFPWDVFGKQVRRAYGLSATPSKQIGTERQRVACRKLNWWRRTREPGQARRNAVLRKQTLKRRGYDCTKQGLVKITK